MQLQINQFESKIAILKQVIKKQFNEMNRYAGMTMVQKEQGKDDYFSQQGILLILPANISLLTISSTYVGW